MPKNDEPSEIGEDVTRIGGIIAVIAAVIIFLQTDLRRHYRVFVCGIYLTEHSVIRRLLRIYMLNGILRAISLNRQIFHLFDV